MTDILSRIAAKTAERVEQKKQQKPLTKVRREAEALSKSIPLFSFEQALKRPGMSMICEVKKASPSKGIIDEAFPYLSIAREYEAAGADAISVLTEPEWFLGDDRYLAEIRAAVSVPLLRKDFTVDSYQIYEAKLLGADAVLLICALLEQQRLEEYLAIAHETGLSAVVEAHTEAEVSSALKAGARILGVNNRNLKTFEVDLNTSIRLRSLVPEEILFISESGIRTPEDISKLKENKVDAVLIGETLMRSTDKKQRIDALKEKTNEN